MQTLHAVQKQVEESVAHRFPFRARRPAALEGPSAAGVDSAADLCCFLKKA